PAPAGAVFLVVDGRRLKAEKRRTRYGGGPWRLTIIDYETEEGIYTVVKEAGELWPPLTTPWYIAPLNWSIEFKTPIPEEITLKIREALPQSTYEDLKKITGIKLDRLKGKICVTPRTILTLLALKSALAQRDIGGEIQKIEKEIATIGGLKGGKLYINLKTPHGAALIGHALGDGALIKVGEQFCFSYVNTEYSYVRGVKEHIQNFGARVEIHKKKRGIRYGAEFKDAYHVSVWGFLAYALYRAIPKALGVKTRGNPKAPAEITRNPELAPHFIKAMIKDEPNIDPRSKGMRIILFVDVTEEIGESRAQKIREIADKQIKEEEKKKGRKLNPMEELHARRVGVGVVDEETRKLAEKVSSNILESIKEALQTMEISLKEEGIRLFNVSPQGNITAGWRICVPKRGVEKIYEKGLLEGSKKEDYEKKYERMNERVRLVDERKNLWKLPKECVEKLREKYEEYKQREGIKVEGMPLSEVMKIPNSKEIVESINKNKPIKLEKKKAELEKKGIKEVELKPTRVYLGEAVVSAKWVLEWFELPKEGDGNG
ncbi:MAG: hypothetical protein QXR19_16530, partial [Candidatus Jordarchaeaceae archaeon]